MKKHTLCGDLFPEASAGTGGIEESFDIFGDVGLKNCISGKTKAVLRNAERLIDLAQHAWLGGRRHNISS